MVSDDSTNVLPLPDHPAVRRDLTSLESRMPPAAEPTRLGLLRRWVTCTLLHRRAYRTRSRYSGNYSRCTICWWV